MKPPNPQFPIPNRSQAAGRGGEDAASTHGLGFENRDLLGIWIGGFGSFFLTF